MADTISTTVLNRTFGQSNLPEGIVLASVASYTVPASGAPGIGDKCSMCPIPAGAIIIGIAFGCAGDGTTDMDLSVGDDGSADRFIAAFDHEAEFNKSFPADGVAATDNVGYQYTADDTIDITFITAAPTAADVYDMVVTYTMAK